MPACPRVNARPTDMLTALSRTTGAGLNMLPRPMSFHRQGGEIEKNFVYVQVYVYLILLDLYFEVYLYTYI